MGTSTHDLGMLDACVYFASQVIHDAIKTQAYATILYEGYTPEISSVHAILSVNGKVSSSCLPLH